MEEFTISNWIALASVGLSLIALVKSFLTDRKAKKLDLVKINSYAPYAVI